MHSLLYDLTKDQNVLCSHCSLPLRVESSLQATKRIAESFAHTTIAICALLTQNTDNFTDLLDRLVKLGHEQFVVNSLITREISEANITQRTVEVVTDRLLAAPETHELIFRALEYGWNLGAEQILIRQYRVGSESPLCTTVYPATACAQCGHKPTLYTTATVREILAPLSSHLADEALLKKSGVEIQTRTWNGISCESLVTRSFHEIARLSSEDGDPIRTYAEILRRVGLGRYTPRTPCSLLSAAEHMRLELAFTWLREIRGCALIIEEPCVGLDASTVHELRTVLSELAERGNAVILIDRGAALAPLPWDNLKNKITTLPPQRAVQPLKPFALTLGKLHTVYSDSPGSLWGMIKSAVNEKLTPTTPPIITSTIPTPALMLRLEHIELEGSVIDGLKLWEPLARLMSSMVRSKELGLRAHAFAPPSSSKRSSYQCKRCGGTGIERNPGTTVSGDEPPCIECQGGRFSDQILQVTFRSKNLRDILNSTIGEALSLLSADPRCARPLKEAHALGLTDITLGTHLNALGPGLQSLVRLAGKVASYSRIGFLALEFPGHTLTQDQNGMFADWISEQLRLGASIISLNPHDSLLTAIKSTLILNVTP